MTSQWIIPTLAVMRLAMRRTLFARRNLWIYLLAISPIILFTVHSLHAPRQQARLRALAAEQSQPTPTSKLLAVRIGQHLDDVLSRLGEPYSRRPWRMRVEGGRTVQRDVIRYTDGRSEFTFRFSDGVLTSIDSTDPESIAKSSVIFATAFQLFFLRLGVFFACVGVFTNLFRGEMLDKSLHFYLLTPVRREALLLGKYLAGLLSTVLIFGLSAALQFIAMLLQFDHAEIRSYMHDTGWSDATAYMSVTILACGAYGSLFLAAGLFFRNPIIPAAVILVWESATVFVPITLKKMSIIYYLQSICPVPPSRDPNMPPVLALLISDSEPATTAGAVIALIVAMTAIVALSAFRTRGLEIAYGAD